MSERDTSLSSTKKMRSYRQRLRGQGLRPVQIWVPDTREKGFQTTLNRQVASLNATDEADALDFIAATADHSD